MTNLLQRNLLESPKLGGSSGIISCTEEKLPNFPLCGAYFDGVRIYPIKPFTMDVDPDSRSLELQVLPEQEDYRPGDTAKVTLRLTSQDGQPIAGVTWKVWKCPFRSSSWVQIQGLPRTRVVRCSPPSVVEIST